jgi:SAM-dependent methyltransferase
VGPSSAASAATPERAICAGREPLRAGGTVTDQEAWQVSGAAAEVYESCFVPAIFGQWAPRLVETARLSSGDRVLDVGCGTGVLARAAADRVAAEGQVTGLDINEGMLAVARRIRPQIDWRQCDATKLPLPDESYVVVMSQFSLMYFPDRLAALKEMMRVLKPGGRLALAVWGPYERARGYVLLTEIATRRCGQAAADVLTAPFVLGDRDALLDLFKAAGVNEVVVELRDGTMTFPTIEIFVETEVKGSPLEPLLDEASYQGLVTEAQDQLQHFCAEGGAVTMPMDAFVVTGGKK